MPTPFLVPRVNNNDDSVRVARLMVRVGEAVRAGDPVAEVVTDKAAFIVDADRDGHIIAVCADEGQVVDVGSVLAWIGDTASDRVPLDAPASSDAPTREPTLKARVLLAEYGIDGAVVSVSGARLSAADVEAHVAERGLGRMPRPATPVDRAVPRERAPWADGRREPLSPERRSMLRTVSWHQTEAVHAYIELRYAPEPWKQCAEAFQEAQRLLFNPLLSLMAWKLVQIVKDRPHVNSTIVEGQRHLYDHVNIGFTVQSGATLYLVVLREAETLPSRTFCNRMTEVQRRAMGDTLGANDVSGATVAFSSMARWNVARHIPVLPPYTSLVVAHSAAAGGEAIFGATYDHRVLTGADVATLLEELGSPPSEDALACQSCQS